MRDPITVEKIKDAAQILDVVSDFVTLRRRGVSYVGLCPFHSDKNPSFYVTPSKNICKCFACGEGGPPVNFIMKHENISYHEALRWLAKKYGIEIKERQLTDAEKQHNTDRESMSIVNDWAQKFFTSRLYEHEEGKTIGLPYFRERGFREDIIRKFQLGYSLLKRTDLYETSIAQGFKETYLLKTGLCYKRDDGKVSDRFHGRAIFPVHSISGKIVAFGGRVLKKDYSPAKYVNSPESELYSKRREVYGLFFAKRAIMKEDKCFLVEGYTDVISMHQSGIENVVASSGTALTKEQIALIHRFTNNITVLYDGDAAGIKAAIRGIDMFLEEGMNVKVVLLPEGEDPDSYAKAHNSFDFKLFIDSHETDFIRFKTALLKQEASEDPLKKSKLTRDIMESVAVIPDPVTRSIYIKECSQTLDISEQILIEEVRKLRERNGRRSREETRTAAHHAPTPTDPKEPMEPMEPPMEPLEPTMEPMEPPMEPLEPKMEPSLPLPQRQPFRESPLKRYEAQLLKYVVRYGEIVLFNSPEIIKVAQFINNELVKDSVPIATPLYKQILDEAIEQCNDDRFNAERYFLNHSNQDVVTLTTNMLSSKYQLSKFFKEEEIDEEALTYDEKRSLALIKEQKEREELERCIIYDLFAIKNAHIKMKIAAVMKQMKEHKDDAAKICELMQTKQELDNIKTLLGDKLGGRTIA